jgi:hypothetical protein
MGKMSEVAGAFQALYGRARLKRRVVIVAAANQVRLCVKVQWQGDYHST